MYTQTNMFLLVNRISSLWLAFSPPVRQFIGSNPGQIKLETMKLVIAAKNASQSRTKSDWLIQNQENMSEWSDISIRGRLFHRVRTIKSNFRRASGRLQSAHNQYLIELVLVHDIAEKLLTWS